MNLDDKIWSTFKGGYKIPYDASVPLKQLQSATDQKLIDTIFAELWENLHHQGDVGLASYFAVLQLIKICIDKKSLDWNFIGLCTVIEHCRQMEHNPKLPSEFDHTYFNALENLGQYLISNFKNIKDQTTLRFTLALFATLNGQSELGKAIEKMDDDVLQEFLAKF